MPGCGGSSRQLWGVAMGESTRLSFYVSEMELAIFKDREPTVRAQKGDTILIDLGHGWELTTQAPHKVYSVTMASWRRRISKALEILKTGTWLDGQL